MQADSSPLLLESIEIIEILEFRAQEINSQLYKYKKFTEVNRFLENFNKLHYKHIQALKEGKIVLAHEILIKIYRLSYELEKKLLGKIYFPEIVYSTDFNKPRKIDEINYLYYIKIPNVICKYLANDILLIQTL